MAFIYFFDRHTDQLTNHDIFLTNHDRFLSEPEIFAACDLTNLSCDRKNFFGNVKFKGIPKKMPHKILHGSTTTPLKTNLDFEFGVTFRWYIWFGKNSTPGHS